MSYGREFSKIYFGYYKGYSNTGEILLCISEDPSQIVYYMESIRKLSYEDYFIKEVFLSKLIAYEMYPGYVLEEYSDDIKYLTMRDLIYLGEEIESSLQHWEDTLQGLKDFQINLIGNPKLSNLSDDVNITIESMTKALGKVKTIRRLSNQVVWNSMVFTHNIHSYLKLMGVQEEIITLDQMYRERMEDDNS